MSSNAFHSRLVIIDACILCWRIYWTAIERKRHQTIHSTHWHTNLFSQQLSTRPHPIWWYVEVHSLRTWTIIIYVVTHYLCRDSLFMSWPIVYVVTHCMSWPIIYVMTHCLCRDLLSMSWPIIYAVTHYVPWSILNTHPNGHNDIFIFALRNAD